MTASKFPVKSRSRARNARDPGFSIFSIASRSSFFGIASKLESFPGREYGSTGSNRFSRCVKGVWTKSGGKQPRPWASVTKKSSASNPCIQKQSFPPLATSPERVFEVGCRCNKSNKARCRSAQFSRAGQTRDRFRRCSRTRPRAESVNTGQ